MPFTPTPLNRPNDNNAADLHPEDVSAAKLLFTRALAGLQEVAKATRAVEEELKRLGPQPKNVVPIASKGLNDARKLYRTILARAVALAAQVGIKLTVEQLLSRAELAGDDDVGAIDMNNPDNRRIVEDIRSGGIAPGAGIIIMGEEFALRAIAKVGLRKAVQGGGAFARASLAGARQAAKVLFRVGGKWITPAVQTAIVAAVGWFAAGTAIRIAAPGVGAGLGRLFSTTGGLILGGFALYLLLNRR